MTQACQARRASQRKEADALFSKLIRSVGRCEYDRDDAGPHVGVLQCAHGFSRRYLATRFDRLNAWCLCRSHHFWFGYHPIEWDSWMRAELGEAVYEGLRFKALAGGRPDYATLIPHLRDELANRAS